MFFLCCGVIRAGSGSPGTQMLTLHLVFGLEVIAVL
jgi:hypothetical protein